MLTTIINFLFSFVSSIKKEKNLNLIHDKLEELSCLITKKQMTDFSFFINSWVVLAQKNLKSKKFEEILGIMDPVINEINFWDKGVGLSKDNYKRKLKEIITQQKQAMDWYN
jgi:hypothetical protein